MLVSRDFLDEVGLMDESYFLYYEETDWAMRGKERYRLAYADDAVVYHKEGASIGSSHQRAKRSALYLPSFWFVAAFASPGSFSRGRFRRSSSIRPW